jgi:hypothetical protein
MIALAFGWGVAEASLFFVVPDVLLGWIALRRGVRAGLSAALAAAAGAALGGGAMLLWAAADPDGARAAILALPAIDADMMAGLRDRMNHLGTVPALLLASLTGVPYKIGAVLMPDFGWSLIGALAVTPLIRLPRFLLTVLIAAAARRLELPPRIAAPLYFGGWAVFYAFYWAAPW